MNISVKQAFRIIQWYNVYRSEILSDDDKHIYDDVLSVLKECHDKIHEDEEDGNTYHEYYKYTKFLEYFDTWSDEEKENYNQEDYANFIV